MEQMLKLDVEKVGRDSEILQTFGMYVSILLCRGIIQDDSEALLRSHSTLYSYL